MNADAAGHHGFTEAQADELVRALGILEHNAEDHALSDILHRKLDRPVMVYGDTAYVQEGTGLVRYRLDPAERRRVLNLLSTGNAEGVVMTLLPPEG